MMDSADVISQFAMAMRAHGIEPPDRIDADGILHRFHVKGERSKRSGAYRLHIDGRPAGWFQNWKTGAPILWRADRSACPMTAEQSRQFRREVAELRAARDTAKVEAQAAAAEAARERWKWARPADPAHLYLRRKVIQPYSIRQSGDLLLVPLCDADGVLHSLQTIDGEGVKLFAKDGRTVGVYHAIGKPDGIIIICEGYATGASLHQATGYAVAVAFTCGNLLAVAEALRAKLPEAVLILAADDDVGTDGNPGLSCAAQAAQAVGGLLAVADFGAHRPAKASDFNDLHQLRGLDAVRACVESAKTVGEEERTVAGIAPIAVARAPEVLPEWGLPEPFSARVDPEPYPLGALPDSIREAVEEVASYVQAPVPMVACAALAAVATAAQAYVDVRRDERLQGPVSLFLLTVGDSGERKTTCDGYFSSPIREWEAERSASLKPELGAYATSIAAWTAEREGLLAAIREGAKSGKDTGKSKQVLAELEASKPHEPRVPSLFLQDVTPEALAVTLAKRWPAVCIASAEAGVILGAHGMNPDTAMRNFGLLNVLWEGGEFQSGRKTTESVHVRGARLSMSLMVQEATLRTFLEKAGTLARGSGFMARFLIAWPESTQGTRAYREPPAHWPKLARFHSRLRALLDTPLDLAEEGGVVPVALALSPEAKQKWIAFHDAIEAQLADGGDLRDVRDVASKSADNAARLAALFDVFELGFVRAVGADAMRRAGQIAAWHLSESRRFFGELALPAELGDAVRLEAWLINHAKRKATASVAKNFARQHGPLRDGRRLKAALAELAERGRLRLDEDHRPFMIRLHPALLESVA
jgi:putative DNA primase/helicase